MKFIPLNPSLAGQWDQVVRHSDDAWVFHLYDWLPLTEKNWDLEPKSFLVEYEGKIVAVFPLQLNKRSKSLKSTYMGLGGAALINGLQQGVRKKIMKAMHEQVRLIASESKSPFIEVLLSPLSESSLQNQWQVNPLVQYGYEDSSSHTFMVDLKLSQEEIFNNYSHDAKREIKIATEKGFTVEALGAISEMEQFYEAHCENRKRTGVEAHPKDFFVDFYNQYYRKGSAMIIQAKDPAGQAIAFEVTGFFKKGALYWMGCCKTEFLDTGVNCLLQYHSMRWAKDQGAQWFENGEAFPNVQEGKLHGLTVFKGKFGGQLHRLFKGRIALNNPGRLKRITDTLTGTFDLLKGMGRK